MVTDILNETQPCFIESGKDIIREYPMALYKDAKGVYQVVHSGTYVRNDWRFVARFKSKHQAIAYNKYLARHKSASWHVYFDNDKCEYITMTQENLNKINPRWRLMDSFSSLEEADKYAKDHNFFYRINNESEEIKYNTKRAEAAEHEDEEDDGVISSFDEAYKLFKEGKKVMGRPKGGSLWVDFSERLDKLYSEWEFHKEEYHLDVKLTSDKNIEKIMHAICQMEDVEEVVRK